MLRRAAFSRWNSDGASGVPFDKIILRVFYPIPVAFI